MEARLIGLQGSGKTTLLDALSEGKGGTGIASVKVQDSRVTKLADIFNPKKTTMAEMRMREVAWPKGEGRKGEMDRYIDALQGANVFLHVVRGFDNPMLGEPVRPVSDLLELDQSFLVSDLMICERIEHRAKKAPLPEAGKRAITKCRESLESEIALRDVEFDANEEAELRSYGFASRVPQVVLVNIESGGSLDPELEEMAAGRRIVALPFADAKEVSELSADEQLEYAEALGLPGPAAEIVTRAVFEQMGLISFFTVGEDEVRAWSVRKGSNARESAGAIHSDLSRGFIRAETVAYDDFIEAAGEMKTCRDRGTLRLEGKEYIVADGDILNIRFNV